MLLLVACLYVNMTMGTSTEISLIYFKVQESTESERLKIKAESEHTLSVSRMVTESFMTLMNAS